MTREEAAAQIAAVLEQLPMSVRHNVLVDTIDQANARSEAYERSEFEARRARILAERQAARQRIGGGA